MVVILSKVLSFLGRGICHQGAAVTFSSDLLTKSNLCKIYMPLCSRCTGIYIGFIISLIIIIFVDHYIKSEAPSFKIIIIVIAALLLMGIDVSLSFYGFIKPNNYIRFSTGFFAGWTLALLVLPVANNVIWYKAVKKSYLNSKIKSLTWTFSGLFLWMLFLIIYRFLNYNGVIIFLGIISIIGVITFYAFIILILFFSIFKKYRNSVKTTKKHIISFIIGVFISSGLLILSSLLRKFI
jgi:uncharacterized membrane protein